MTAVYSVLADATLVLHFAFIVFVVAGGFLALRWPRIAWIHIPCAIWGAYVEFAGRVCPLTPLENRFREMAGGRVYEGGFIERYLAAVMYPSGLDRSHQLVLGTGVIVVNLAAYALLLRRRSAKTEAGTGSPGSDAS